MVSSSVLGRMGVVDPIGGVAAIEIETLKVMWMFSGNARYNTSQFLEKSVTKVI